jgi:hypothetical protein
LLIAQIVQVTFIIMQVAASTNKEVDAQIPNYPNLPPQLICQLHNVTMHVSSHLMDHHVVFIFFFPFKEVL